MKAQAILGSTGCEACDEEENRGDKFHMQVDVWKESRKGYNSAWLFCMRGERGVGGGLDDE